MEMSRETGNQERHANIGIIIPVCMNEVHTACWICELEIYDNPKLEHTDTFKAVDWLRYL